MLWPASLERGRFQWPRLAYYSSGLEAARLKALFNLTGA